MTQTKHNPPSDQAPADPGRALRIARLAIALGLVVGVLVFAVLTVQSLAQLREQSIAMTAGPDYGIAKTQPSADVSPQSLNPLAGLATLDPARYPLIDRPNPHPGEIVPFKNTAPLSQPPYHQAHASEVWEFCVYELPDASQAELIAYYNQQAKSRGMHQVRQRPSAKHPGGIVAAWTDGRNGLEVSTNPLPSTKPVQAPLAPPTPLRWVVKYSYPKPTPTR